MASDNSGADLRSVIEQADKIIGGGLEPEDLFLAVESYTQRFSQWFSAFEKRGGAGSEDEALLRSLSEKHEKVLSIAVGLKDDAAESMQQFRARARAIMKYADQLPRKISLKRPRKG